MIEEIKKNIKPGTFGNVLMRYASAQVISNLLRMLSGFLVVSFIKPELYGQFTGVGVYMGYMLLGHGGIINGLGRELPYELGRGNDRYAREMASSVYVLSLIISILTSLIFLGFGIGHFISGKYLSGLIFMTYSLIGGLNLLNNQFLPTLYRTNKDFDSLSRQNILLGFCNLLTVLLVWGFGIYGLMIRGVILALYAFFLLFNNKPYALTLNYDLRHFKKLFKTGLSIFIVGQVNPLWTTIMNNIIFSMGGALNFGLYALSSIVQGAIGIIPGAFSQVIYPRMSIMFGEGKSVSYIIKANIKPLLFQSGVITVGAIIVALLLPFVIPVLLPKYTEGVTAAQWIVFVPVVQSFGALNNIYNVVKKQQWYFFSLIMGAIIGTLFIYWKVKTIYFQLEFFSQGLLIGYAVQQALSIGFLSTLKKNG